MAEPIYKFDEKTWLEQLTKTAALTPKRSLILRVRSNILNLNAKVYQLRVDGRTIRARLAPSTPEDSKDTELWFSLPGHHWEQYGIQTKEPNHAKFSYFYMIYSPWSERVPMEVRIDISTDQEIADEPDYDTPVQ
jgi:hypothetical protein